MRLITGTVVDSLTHAPLAGVSVILSNTGKGRLTDAMGKFRIAVGKGTHKILFTATGYSPASLLIPDTPIHPLVITMSVSYTALKDVVIRSKLKYRNKNNPAVELIRQVIAHKEINAPVFYPFQTYDQYDKVRVLADRPPRAIADGRLFRRYHFLFASPDTSLVPGKSLTPAYMEETITRNYSRTNPDRSKQVILGHKRADLGEYIDMGGISAIITRLYEDFSVYDNTMQVFTLQFMSPAAKLGPDLYEYFIRDTTEEQGIRLIRLDFTPRNPEDLLFKGSLFITLDGSYAIRRAEMEASPRSNLNWVRSFRITQTFEKGPGNRYYRSLSDMLTYFSLMRNNLGFYGERSLTVYRVADSVLPDAVFRGLPVDTMLLSIPQPDSFWAAERPAPLTPSEARTYVNTDSLVKMRSYRRMMDIVTLLTAGYKSAGKFDIGPVGNFYSYNSLEGSRYQFEGRSNAKLSTRYFTDDYVAYSTNDHRWKYSVSGTYSINHHSVYTYPFHYIRGSFVRDVRNPGAETEFSQDNRFLSSFSRGIGGKWLYTNIGSLSYVREFGDHFSYNLGMRYWLQQPAQSLYYIYEPPSGPADTLSQLKTTQLSLTLSWAPHELFYQGRATRRTITNRYPTFSLQYAIGIKGLLGGGYTYNAFQFSVAKRWYVAPLGYTDIRFSAGYVTGNLPFPLLIIAPANTALHYSFGSYNLMNVAEFVSDHFGGLNIDHYFNGFFLNKVPLLKKLRLREVVEGKILYGGLRPENNPALNPNQMKFPLEGETGSGRTGVYSTYGLGSQPYIEAGVGIANILRVLRLDVVRRFTYLSHPGISTMGVRFSLGLDF